jgi:CO dehydrogenase nickel-insertion accessory protein CooC1
MDALLVVVTSSPWSVETAHRIKTLAGQVGLRRLFAVANGITDQAELEPIRVRLGDIPLIGHIRHDGRLVSGVVKLVDGVPTPTEACRDQQAGVMAILEFLNSLL